MKYTVFVVSMSLIFLLANPAVGQRSMRLSKFSSKELEKAGLHLNYASFCDYSAPGDTAEGYLFVLNNTTHRCAVKVDGKVVILQDTTSTDADRVTVVLRYCISERYSLKMAGPTFVELNLLITDRKTGRQKTVRVVGGCEP